MSRACCAHQIFANGTRKFSRKKEMKRPVWRLADLGRKTALNWILKEQLTDSYVSVKSKSKV
jgi:hypothetical protein